MSMIRPLNCEVTVTLIYGKVIMPFLLTLSWYFSYFFQITNESDPTFNLNILTGHYDLISWFRHFALYLNTQWVYDYISFT